MKKLLVMCVLVLSCSAGAVFAHSGGTDKNGCHMDHRTGVYHCH